MQRKVKRTYVYECSVGHEVRLDRPFACHIVGCQAMVKAGFNDWDYTTCGLWCWPKVEKSTPSEDADAR